MIVYVWAGLACWQLLENRYVIIDFSTMFLSHTLGYPDDVTTFLLFELQVRIEHSEVELLNECEHIQFNLKKKNVFNLNISEISC